MSPFKIADYSPTNRQKLEAQKTCDIIHPSSQGLMEDIIE
jgi:hypothetical protein